MNKPLLSIIVPTYNEELGIDELYRRTKAVLIFGFLPLHY
jgi:glycosyltransferase involved in cell wall biosynthesis